MIQIKTFWDDLIPLGLLSKPNKILVRDYYFGQHPMLGGWLCWVQSIHTVRISEGSAMYSVQHQFWNLQRRVLLDHPGLCFIPDAKGLEDAMILTP